MTSSTLIRRTKNPGEEPPMAARPRPPDHLPPHVRDHPAVIASCARRDIGGLFRTINNLTEGPGCFTASHIARRCELTPSRVAEYMSGKRHASSVVVITRVAVGLGIPLNRFGLDKGLGNPRELAYGSHTQPPEAWELLDAITRANISFDALAQMERVVLTSAIRYPSTGPHVLLPSVLSMMSRLHSALSQPQSARNARRCTRLVGILAGLAGNLFLDLGDQCRAQSYFEVGCAAGREAEDDPLTAWVLATQSIGPTFAGLHQRAAQLLDQAAQLVTGRGNRRREAWVLAMAARAHAALGDERRTQELLDQSSSALASAEAPSGIDFFDSARLQGIAGTSHLRTGNTTRAEPLLIDALQRREKSDIKGRALLTLDLAQCKVADGEVEEACQLTHSALDLAAGSLVRPIADRAGSIQHDLGGWRTLTPVAVLSERLRDETAALPG
jgi:transcriptional regulator with XRE-family HTH domain